MAFNLKGMVFFNILKVLVKKKILVRKTTTPTETKPRT